jgi:hypothetical protein
MPALSSFFVITFVLCVGYGLVVPARFHAPWLSTTSSPAAKAESSGARSRAHEPRSGDSDDDQMKPIVHETAGDVPHAAGSRLRSRSGIALLVFLGIAVFFLVTEHTGHVLVLPYLGLACPLMHFFHGVHTHRHGPDGTPGCNTR